MLLLQLELDKKRIYGLDILRAIAILLVILEHGGNFFPEHIAKLQLSVLLDGVSIFFVLSGFLIGKILLQTLEKEEVSYKTLLNFWKRRWYRTLPNYFLILLLLLIFSTFSIYNAPQEISKYILFLQNFNQSHPNFFPEAWSLSVEEWFYILIPLIVTGIILFLKTNVKKALLVTTITIILFSISYRYHKYSTIIEPSFFEWDENFRKQVLTRLDSIMFGIFASYIFYYHNTFWNKYKNVFFISGIVILTLQKILYQSYTLSQYDFVFSFSMYSIAFMLLLPFLSNLKTGDGYIYQVLSRISIISYSMYLLNLSVIQISIIENINWFNITGGSLIAIKYLFYWLFTIIGSILLYKYYELPFMNLRDKTF